MGLSSFWRIWDNTAWLSFTMSKVSLATHNATKKAAWNLLFCPSPSLCRPAAKLVSPKTVWMLTASRTAWSTPSRGPLGPRRIGTTKTGSWRHSKKPKFIQEWPGFLRFWLAVRFTKAHSRLPISSTKSVSQKTTKELIAMSSSLGTNTKGGLAGNTLRFFCLELGSSWGPCTHFARNTHWETSKWDKRPFRLNWKDKSRTRRTKTRFLIGRFKPRWNSVFCQRAKMVNKH